MSEKEELDKLYSQMTDDDKDQFDFVRIWCHCSKFDSDGNFRPGKWSKLNDSGLPFSDERTKYLLGKFIFKLDPNINPRIPE